MVKEKKNQQFAVRLEYETAQSVKKLSERLNLSMGELVRWCVSRQLKKSSDLTNLVRKRKTLQFSVRFESGLTKNLAELANQLDISQGEIIRLCVTKQLDQIKREGGIKINLAPDGK